MVKAKVKCVGVHSGLWMFVCEITNVRWAEI